MTSVSALDAFGKARTALTRAYEQGAAGQELARLRVEVDRARRRLARACTGPVEGWPYEVLMALSFDQFAVRSRAAAVSYVERLVDEMNRGAA